MNAFPLAPFLYALIADGISVSFSDYDRISTVLSTGDKWSLKRLRGVLIALLAHNTDEAERIRRRFDSFFITPDNNELSAEQVNYFLDVLRKAVSEEAPVPPVVVVDEPISAGASRTIYIPPRKPYWRRPLVWGMMLGVLATGIIGFQIYRRRESKLSANTNSVQQPQQAGRPNQEKTNDTTGPALDPPVQRLPQNWSYAGELRLDAIGPVARAPSKHHWTDLLATIIAFFLLVLFWLSIRALVSKALREPPPRFNPNSPRLFPFSALGEAVRPQLDGPTLDRLADSVNYYLSIRPSKRLDIGRTIRETGRNAGMPTLSFYRQRQVRRVCIFEDSQAEPLIWNSISRELLEGLSKRGVDVLYGQFTGTLDKFVLSDGQTYWLDDLDNERRDSLFLFFSDGKHLGSRRDAFALERLARLPLVAWFDLREPKFWDETALIIKTHGIPLYVANPKGLIRAFDRFLLESATERDDSAAVRHWRGFTPYTDGRLAVYIEHVLGDALVWAQACAMIQPLSLKLAHTLRREFQPHLPPQRIERLFRLPGTSWQGSCLRFSREVLAALRGGFNVRLTPDEQEKILHFIQDQIRAREPLKSERSLRRLVWEWTLRRVQLESSPDEVLPVLSQLSQTPLGPEIKWDLSHLVFVDQPQSTERAMIPLRARPATPKGVAYLKAFSPHIVMSDSLPEAFRFNWQRLQFILKKIWIYTSLDIVTWWRERRAAHTHTAAAVKSNSDSQDVIFAEPEELVLKRLFVGEIKTCTVTFRTTSQAGLVGRFVSDNEWLKVTPSTCDLSQKETTVTVIIDTRALKPGKHAGNITFISADNLDPLDVPVELELYFSWKDLALDWWQRNRPKQPVRTGVLSLILFAGLVVVTFKVLPANWPNRLINRPPRLLELKELPDEDLPSDMIALEAVTDAAEGEKIAYEWTSDWGKVIGNWKKPILVAGNSSKPQTVKLTVTLNDSDGGYDSYSVPLLFQQEGGITFPFSANDYYHQFEYSDADLLRERLRSSDPRERWIAATSLSYVPLAETDAIPILIKSLEDHDVNVVSKTMASLSQFYSKDVETALSTIINRLQNDKSVEVRMEAATALAGFSRYHRLTVPALLKAMEDKSEAVSNAAAASLGKIGPAAINGLKERLTDPHFGLRIKRLAATALAGDGMKKKEDIAKIVSTLVDIVTDDEYDTELRRRAAYSVAQLRLTEEIHVRRLVETLKDKSAPVRSAVASILWSLSSQSKFSDLLTPALFKAMEDSNAEVRRNATAAIGNMYVRPAGSEQLLLKNLTDSNAEVRQYAIAALTYGATEPKQVAPQIIAILNDSKVERVGAAEALGRFNFNSDDGRLVTDAIRALQAIVSNSNVDSELRHTSAYSLAKLAWLDETVTSGLSRFFTSSDPHLRDAAISAIWDVQGRSTSASTVVTRNDFSNELGAALADESDFVRAHAAFVFSIGPDRDRSDITASLTNLALTDATVAPSALTALFRERPFCSLVPKLLKSRFSSVRSATLAAVDEKNCFSKDAELKDQVFELISNDNSSVGAVAAATLDSYVYYGNGRRHDIAYDEFEAPFFGERHIDSRFLAEEKWLYERALTLLNNPSYRVRFVGLVLISKSPSDEKLSAILGLLHDSDPRIRRKAVFVLFDMKGEAALGYLREFRDQDLRVRYALELGRINLQNEFPRRSLSATDHRILIDIYRHGDSYSSLRARSLLSDFGYYSWNDDEFKEPDEGPE